MTKPHRPGDNVKAEMARRGFSQADLAEVLEKSQAAISRRLNSLTPFDVDELIVVAKWLGVSVSLLLGEDVAA